jgi:phosphoglycerate dehydrogenase-like enzyme
VPPVTLPVVVVEDDPFLRVIQVALDPATLPERVTAFSHFFEHEEPDFCGWCERLRRRLKRLHPAQVRLAGDGAAFIAELPGATAAVVESFTMGEREIAIAGDSLRTVQKYGTVTRNIDIEACARAGVQVLVLRRRANIACAEHAFGLLLALARKIHETAGLVSVEQLRAAGYAPTQFDRSHTANANWARVTNVRTLFGRQLGIVGLGEIGRELALCAAALGMHIVYTQRRRLPASEESRYQATYAAMDDLLAGSDCVSLHLPGNAATHGIIGGRELALMKRGALLVNVSRAELIDRGALLASLASGQLGGVGLDPPYDEPGRADDPLLAFPNAIVTPHLAAAPRFNALDDFEELLTGLDRALLESTARTPRAPGDHDEARSGR